VLPDEARRLLGECVFVGSRDLAYSLNGLASGDALDPDEHAETQAELELLVADGKAPVELLQAFRIAASDNRRRYERQLRHFRREVAKRGARAVGTAAEDSFGDGATFGAFVEACEELERRSPRPEGALYTRARESRPRSRRSRASSSSDDDGLADLPRRCPDCGGATRPLLPSPQWRCDPCAEALWERMVDHEVQRVLAEAEQITQGEAA
jgi:hypothetical protein